MMFFFMDKIHLTPEEVFEKLVNDYNIKSVTGGITFNLGEVGIIVKQRDVIGNLIQEWVEGWLKANNIFFNPNPNTQMPPDIFLNEDRTKDLLEVKAFNSGCSPAFDIADFSAYISEIIEKPYMLHTKYLIFAYKMSEEGVVTIKGIWLKSVWEICRAMDKKARFTINVQNKEKTGVSKIRPAAFYSTKNVRYPVFETLEDFLVALEESIYLNSATRHLINNGWKDKMIEAYRNCYGITLNIGGKRWTDIEHKYRLAPAPKKSNKKSNE